MSVLLLAGSPSSSSSSLRLLIEEGRIALDLRIDLPRPRSRGSVDFATLEERILQRVLQRAH
jgi:hypothetical protein